MKLRIIKNLIVTLITIVILTSFYQKKDDKLKITKENLIGVYWSDEESVSAYFGIYEDTIYYPDPDIWVKYELEGDTIVITRYDNSIEKFLILKLTTDSLVFNNFDFDMEVHLSRKSH